jgi:hypothetical protein
MLDHLYLLYKYLNKKQRHNDNSHPLEISTLIRKTKKYLPTDDTNFLGLNCPGHVSNSSSNHPNQLIPIRYQVQISMES